MLRPVQVLQATKPASQFVGRLPADLHLSILTHLSIPDVASYARVCRAARNVVCDERLWERRWLDLAVERLQLGHILDVLESKTRVYRTAEKSVVSGPATIAVSALEDDDFGDFKSATTTSNVPQLLLDLSDDVVNNTGGIFKSEPTTSTFRGKYIRAHTLLIPFVPTPTSSAHTVLASIGSSASSLHAQGQTLHLLARFLSPFIKPISAWDVRLVLLKTALDRFDAGLLTAFDKADTEDDEGRMTEVAAASWEVWMSLHLDGNRDGLRGEWEMGRVWVEKREVLYEQGRWDPLANITYVLSLFHPPFLHSYITFFYLNSKDKRLDFTPMDTFMSRLLTALQDDGKMAVKVFPPEAGVLLGYTERVAGEVVSFTSWRWLPLGYL